MDFIAQLRQALGLGADVPEADVLAAVTAHKSAVDTHSASIKAIAKAAGLDEAVSPDALITELQARQSSTDPQLATLRETVVELNSQLSALQDEASRDKATRFVDDAIREGRVGVVKLREHYIEQHMADAARVEKEIGAFPVLNAQQRRQTQQPDPANPVAALSDDQLKVCELMGVDPVEFASLNAEKELV